MASEVTSMAAGENFPTIVSTPSSGLSGRVIEQLNTDDSPNTSPRMTDVDSSAHTILIGDDYVEVSDDSLCATDDADSIQEDRNENKVHKTPLGDITSSCNETLHSKATLHSKSAVQSTSQQCTRAMHFQNFACRKPSPLIGQSKDVTQLFLSKNNLQASTGYQTTELGLKMTSKLEMNNLKTRTNSSHSTVCSDKVQRIFACGGNSVIKLPVPLSVDSNSKVAMHDDASVENNSEKICLLPKSFEYSQPAKSECLIQCIGKASEPIMTFSLTISHGFNKSCSSKYPAYIYTRPICAVGQLMYERDFITTAPSSKPFDHSTGKTQLPGISTFLTRIEEVNNDNSAEIRTTQASTASRENEYISHEISDINRAKRHYQKKAEKRTDLSSSAAGMDRTSPRAHKIFNKAITTAKICCDNIQKSFKLNTISLADLHTYKQMQQMTATAFLQFAAVGNDKLKAFMNEPEVSEQNEGTVNVTCTGPLLPSYTDTSLHSGASLLSYTGALLPSYTDASLTSYTSASLPSTGTSLLSYSGASLPSYNSESVLSGFGALQRADMSTGIENKVKQDDGNMQAILLRPARTDLNNLETNNPTKRSTVGYSTMSDNNKAKNCCSSNTIDFQTNCMKTILENGNIMNTNKLDCHQKLIKCSETEMETVSDVVRANNNILNDTDYSDTNVDEEFTGSNHTGCVDSSAIAWEEMCCSESTSERSASYNCCEHIHAQNTSMCAFNRDIGHSIKVAGRVSPRLPGDPAELNMQYISSEAQSLHRVSEVKNELNNNTNKTVVMSGKATTTPQHRKRSLPVKGDLYICPIGPPQKQKNVGLPWKALIKNLQKTRDVIQKGVLDSHNTPFQEQHLTGQTNVVQNRATETFDTEFQDPGIQICRELQFEQIMPGITYQNVNRVIHCPNHEKVLVKIIDDNKVAKLNDTTPALQPVSSTVSTNGIADQDFSHNRLCPLSFYNQVQRQDQCPSPAAYNTTTNNSTINGYDVITQLQHTEVHNMNPYTQEVCNQSFLAENTTFCDDGGVHLQSQVSVTEPNVTSQSSPIQLELLRFCSSANFEQINLGDLTSSDISIPMNNALTPITFAAPFNVDRSASNNEFNCTGLPALHCSTSQLVREGSQAYANLQFTSIDVSSLEFYDANTQICTTQNHTTDCILPRSVHQNQNTALYTANYHMAMPVALPECNQASSYNCVQSNYFTNLLQSDSDECYDMEQNISGPTQIVDEMQCSAPQLSVLVPNCPSDSEIAQLLLRLGSKSPIMELPMSANNNAEADNRTEMTTCSKTLTGHETVRTNRKRKPSEGIIQNSPLPTSTLKAKRRCIQQHHGLYPARRSCNLPACGQNSVLSLRRCSVTLTRLHLAPADSINCRTGRLVSQRKKPYIYICIKCGKCVSYTELKSSHLHK